MCLKFFVDGIYTCTCIIKWEIIHIYKFTCILHCKNIFDELKNLDTLYFSLKYKVIKIYTCVMLYTCTLELKKKPTIYPNPKNYYSNAANRDVGVEWKPCGRTRC